MRTFVLTLALAASLAAADGKWISLFDGKTLKGWKAEGNASWTIEDGAIVGRQGPGGAAGDLFTEAQFTDFEMEAEWKMKFPGNSGLWFRVNGARTGYQADFLEQQGLVSGSLYCMGKAFIAENKDPATVNRDGWNKLRVIASGDHIIVEQNGKRLADVRDSAFPGPGSAGIQVHRGDAFTGMEVRLRNIRLRKIAR